MEEIVISGISGRFPSSNNLNEFAYNLYNKIDMTDEDESRWKHFHNDVPRRFGKIRNLEKFDASFFSTLNKHANWTDPQMRILLEHSYEAILDAGISPQSLNGSKTGVFIGCSLSDSRDVFTHRVPPKDGYVVLGNANFYLSNRISYALGLCGPSFTVDTACSSSAYALDCAFRYLQSGICDAALVGGSQLILNCGLTAEYTKLGILASDGVCRPFDEDATGFSRADTICVIFLQKLKDSKRIYANLVYSSSNNDGFKKEGASFPSKIMQQKLIEDFYKNLKFDPELVNFVEAHSTGTKLGDPEEVSAIDEAFCKNNNRSRELIIGSVKSNMGHAEAASGMASIAKILIALENKKFPPNINIKNPRSDVTAFTENRIKVAMETENLDSDFIAMNSFGLGGGNAHALFRGNSKEKINFGIPIDSLDRLVCWSGRTEAAVNTIFDDITQRPLDSEHIALLHNSQKLTTTANTCRGFAVFKHDVESEKAICLARDIKFFDGTRRPIVFVFTGIGSQWSQMGASLMEIPIFNESINKSHEILQYKFGMDLKSIILKENDFSNVLHSYVGIVAIEIAIVDILKSLNIQPDFIIGHSVGELCCAYADGCFTAEETILAAHARGVSSNEAKTIDGGMAAVGMNHLDLEKILPQDIDIACHNGIDSTTISGPELSVKNFVEELKEKKIFAKEVACSGIPLHSRYILEFGVRLFDKLKNIIKNPRTRSMKWLSSTYPEDMWNEEEAFYSSAQYHTRNLLNPVFFQEVTEMLPSNALTIEIAPHGLLKSILKRSLKDGVHISLTQRDNLSGLNFFNDGLGKLFQHGIDMDLSKLYPPIQFPVSRGTPMISPLIKWNHEENHFVPHFDSYNTFERRNITINISDKNFEFLQGHIIDGRFLFPATGWICLVWETFSMMIGMNFQKVRVILEDIYFLRATSLNKNQDVLITIAIHRGTGRFEVIEGSAAVCHGYIKNVDNIEMSEISPLSDEGTITLDGEEFYKGMRLNGFCHLGAFKGVKEIRHDGRKGKIKWIHNWMTFLDSMTHFEELETDARQLALPTNLRKIVIDPIHHYEMLEEKLKEKENEEEEILFNVEICPYLRIIKAGGVEMHDKRNRVVNRRKPREPTIEIHKFIPFITDDEFSIKNAAKIIIQTALEDIFQPKFTCLEIDENFLSENLSKALKEIPLVVGSFTLLTKKENLQLEDVEISQEELTTFSDVDMIVKKNCDFEFLDSVKSLLNDRGYVVSIEGEKIENSPHESFEIVGKLKIDYFTIYLLRKPQKEEEELKIIEITEIIEEWLEPLQKVIKENSVLIYSHNEEPSGILGFINCVRREFPVNKLKCLFINDKAPSDFDINTHKSHLKHSINVYKDGKWGSYRHLEMPEVNKLMPQSTHCYANCLIKGDLSTLTWLRGSQNIENNDTISIKFASLNFKDVMLALGRIPENIKDRLNQQCVLGLEFSGVKKDGSRVMGIAMNAGAISTHYDTKKAIVWNVPHNWSLEEAATVPLVYFTVYFSFFITCQIRRGKSILIHSGSGGIGQAAILIALTHGLEVYTTVSSEEKKNFLLKKFPKIKSKNIGNSRNISFEKMVLENTKGLGVDYVLNSLADEKLHASIRCLGKGGTFLEIGKYDMLKGTQLDMRYLSKRIQFKAVIFDDLSTDSEEMETVYNLIQRDLNAGVIKPLNTTIFNAQQVEDAFRFMATGKHIGKVLLKIREDENEIQTMPIKALNRIYCDPNESYLIVGGLGGFGLELADWLVMRGCRKLILSSSRGFSNGHQVIKVELWKFYGVQVIVSTSDVTTEEGCESLINEALSLGPLGGIFNLAVVLRDGIFENLDVKNFYESLAPKSTATKNLDKFSRVLCPTLKHFVVFSSVSCGVGNAGQSNYGYANSVMERIIEKRHEENLPAKAIQWGAIGDVGLLAEFQLANMNKDIGGTLPQAISSCFDIFDELLTSDDPIVSSMVVADKQSGDNRKGNIIDMIIKIMGVRDRKSISMDSTLTQLGIDSLMGVEIQQLLERDFDIILTSQELRSMTLSELEKKSMRKGGENEVNSNENGGVPDEVTWMKLLVEGVVNTETMEVGSLETVLKINEIDSNTKILIIPGFYGVAANIYKNLGDNLPYESYVIQLVESSECTEIDEILESMTPKILEIIKPSNKFIIVAHSFGTLLSLKIAKLLEKSGRFNGEIIQIDGSPQYIYRLAHKMSSNQDDDVKLRNGISMVLFDTFKNFVDEEKIKEAFLSHDLWEEKLIALIENSKEKFAFDVNYINEIILNAVINRLKICLHTKEESFEALEYTKMSLIRATKSAINGIHQDYGLARFVTSELKIHVVDGDHVTILQNPQLINILSEL